MKLNTTTSIDFTWDAYDKSVAQAQLNNFGIIFLDEYDLPIDNEYELEDLFEEYKKEVKQCYH